MKSPHPIVNRFYETQKNKSEAKTKLINHLGVIVTPFQLMVQGGIIWTIISFLLYLFKDEQFDWNGIICTIIGTVFVFIIFYIGKHKIAKIN
jgi:hypothetical protein